MSNKTTNASAPPATTPAEIRANVLKRLEAIPHPEYPIVLDRSALPASLDDSAAVAKAIRTADGNAFSMIRDEVGSPEKVAESAAAFRQLFNQELMWFLVADQVTEAAVTSTAIKSADRRWFSDGLAAWVALQDVDRRFGPGKGDAAFAKMYNAAELRKQAAKVDLFTWPANEDVKSGERQDVENPNAYSYFAALVMKKACEGREADFVKKWLDEIRKIPLNRANAGTVLAAYQKLTGQDLKSIVHEVVKES